MMFIVDCLVCVYVITLIINLGRFSTHTVSLSAGTCFVSSSFIEVNLILVTVNCPCFLILLIDIYLNYSRNFFFIISNRFFKLKVTYVFDINYYVVIGMFVVCVYCLLPIIVISHT